jgi:cysteine-rich repeat protein
MPRATGAMIVGVLVLVRASTVLGACAGGAPNGVLEPGEVCDDGNFIDGDACCTDCTDLGCPPAGGTCGDGILQRLPGEHFEQCDDGNGVDGDGCQANCTTTLLLPPNDAGDPGNVLFAGFLNQPLGNATLALEPAPGGGQRLRVGGIGGSFLDGVRQLVGSCEMKTALGLPNFSLGGPGTVLTVTQTGIVNGVPGVLFSAVTFAHNGTDIDVVNDLSPLAPQSYRVALFHGRRMVLNVGGLATGDLKVPGDTDIEAADCGVNPDTGETFLTGQKKPSTSTTTTTSTTSTSSSTTTTTLCTCTSGVCSGGPKDGAPCMDVTDCMCATTTTTTSLTLPTVTTTLPQIVIDPGTITLVATGVTVDADAWLVGTEQVTNRPSLQEKIEMFAANTGDVLITDEQTNPPPAAPDCNANGIADDQDIALSTSPDQNANAVPDECEDFRTSAELTDPEVKCQEKVSAGMAKVVGGHTKCVVKCDKAAQKGKVAPGECVAPYGGKTADCALKVIFRGNAATKPCTDCPEGYGGNCPAFASDLTALTRARVEGLLEFVLCDDSASGDGLSPSEAKCRDLVAQKIGGFVAAKEKCLVKCRRLERRFKLPGGSCRAGDVTDAKTAACIRRAEDKTRATLAARCTNLPECLARRFDLVGIVAAAESATDDVDVRVFTPR